jgi:hypothetical protein
MLPKAKSLKHLKTCFLVVQVSEAPNFWISQKPIGSLSLASRFVETCVSQSVRSSITSESFTWVEGQRIMSLKVSFGAGVLDDASLDN